jgi:hypothetical protein
MRAMPNRLSLLLVLLLLASLLFAVAGAHGATAAPVASYSAAEDFEDLEAESEEEGEEEGEFAEVECETALEEAEEGEITRAEANEFCAEVTSAEKGNKKIGGKGGSTSVAPEECLLRSARAHAAVDEKRGKLKLTLGYTTYEPTSAKIEIGHIATLQRHLGRSGVLRLVKGLNKLDAPKKLVVRISIPSARRAGCPSRRLVLFPR